MAKITQINNGDSGLVSRTNINEAMKTVETDGVTITGDGTTANPLVGAQSFVLPESVQRQGNTLVFDLMQGSIYNSEVGDTQTGNITLDATGAKIGAVVACYNDGTTEPSVTPTPNPKAGTWQSGKVNVYWFMWDGTNFTQNIQTQLVVLPDVDTPTFTLASGAAALSLDYSAIVLGNAASSIMEISTDNITFTPVGTYVSGVSGTITGLIDSQLYYVKITSSLSGYNDASATEQATASGQATLAAPSITSVTDAGTDNTVLWGAVANADIYDVYVNASDDFGTASKVVSDTALLTADIAKISGLRNYYFVVAKANSGYNDSAPSLSDSGYGTNVLFYDDFEGTTIDTAKWTLQQGDITTITQNDGLIYTDGSTGTSSTSAKVESIPLIDSSASDVFCVMNIDQSGIVTEVGATRSCQFLDTPTGDNNRIEYTRGGAAQDNLLLAARTRNNTTSSSYTNIGTYDGTFKFSLIGGTVNIYKWSGSAWGASLLSATISDDDFFMRLTKGGLTGAGDVWKIGFIYFTDTDFTSETP